jgi:hypothetical protein
LPGDVRGRHPALMETDMRTIPRIAVTAAAVTAGLALAVVIGVALSLRGWQQDADRQEAKARERMAEQVRTFAGGVAERSRGPGGPTDAELATLGEQSRVQYVRDEQAGSLRSLRVTAWDSVSGLFGGSSITSCSMIEFHDLGTARAGYVVRPLAAC